MGIETNKHPIPAVQSLSALLRRVNTSIQRYGVPLHYLASCAARHRSLSPSCCESELCARQSNSCFHSCILASGKGLYASKSVCNYRLCVYADKRPADLTDKVQRRA